MSELETKIKSWLDEQGYPLEMRVARAFRQAGFSVLQSDYYEDPKTKTQREIDVVATVGKNYEKILFRLQFVIECKLSKNKPWILFCGANQRIAAPARIVQRVSSDIGRSILFDIASREDVQNLDLFEVISPAAYGVTQAFTNNPDVTYTALTNVAIAASAKADEGNFDSILSKLFGFLVFPVVVTEGKLFTATLQEDSSIFVNEVKQGTLLWRNQIADDPHTIVNLVADTEIDDFAKRMFEAAVKFLSLCEKEIVKAAQNYQSQKHLRAKA
jgi:hypothetical protein